jgi:hypothetical protein
MPTSRPQIPAPALGVAVSAVLMRKGYRFRSSEREIDAIANDLRAAYPHLLAVITKRPIPDPPHDYTLGDETKARAWRQGYEAALDSLEETDGGGGR